MKIIVLGAGLVGGPMARDLAADERFEVTAADASAAALETLGTDASITRVEKDLSDPKTVTGLVRDYDMAINAVPGFMGYRTLEAIIEAERNAVDIAFFPESPFPLDEPARERGVVAIMDCGVAPGMSNVLTGYADALLDETRSAITYVGGLPEVRTWPWEYRAVFSPIDVIEEYTRPARYVENGALVTRPALSDPELLDFPVVGTLEAFNTDGLRSLAETIDAPNLKEKTLRYPGHIDKMRLLRECGFFSEEPIEAGGSRVRPIDVTAGLLFPMWQLGPGEVDITVMRIVVEGVKNGVETRYRWDLLDRRDMETGVHSMARTTGYTATVAARMIADGLWDRAGVSPPEYVGRDPECVKYLLAGLAERGIVYEERVELIG